MSMLRFVGATALVLLMAGCGNGTRESAKPAEPTSTTPDCRPLTGRGGKSEPAVATSLLKSVKVEALQCADRVVFGFRDNAGEPPGFTASYEPASSAKIEDGSGRSIEIAGSAFLVIRLNNAATAEISGEEVTPTYTGPRRLSAEGTRFVREVVKTGDFENVVTWVIGLDERRPVSAKASGSQVVVDVG